MNASNNPFAIPSANLIDETTTRKDHVWVVGFIFSLPIWCFTIYGFISEINNYNNSNRKELLGLVIAVSFFLSSLLIFFFPVYWKSFHKRTIALKAIGLLSSSLLVDLLFFSIPIGYNFIRSQHNSYNNRIFPKHLFIVVATAFGIIFFYQLLQLTLLRFFIKRWERKTELTWT